MSAPENGPPMGGNPGGTGNQQFDWVHPDSVVNDLIKNLLIDWNQRGQYLPDPLRYYVDEFIETVPHTVPSSTADEVKN